jgi:hypothetical protein
METQCVFCVVKIKLSLCLTNLALHHEDVWGSGCIDPNFLDLSTSWRWEVNFRLWVGMEKWKLLILLGLELWPLGHVAHSQLLYQLCYPSSCFLCGRNFLIFKWISGLKGLTSWPLMIFGAKGYIKIILMTCWAWCSKIFKHTLIKIHVLLSTLWLVKYNNDKW